MSWLRGGNFEGLKLVFLVWDVRRVGVVGVGVGIVVDIDSGWWI